MDTKALTRLLGQRVRALRIAHGWSQEDLAGRCGRHFTYIGRVERGEQNVTVEVLGDIASALSVAVSDLLVADQPKLLADWRVTATDVVEAVSRGFRAQVDVKGKLAELMLYRELENLRKAGELQAIDWLDEDGKPDFIVKWKGRTVIIECKNVRSADPNRKSEEPIRVELQKTRNSKDGSNTRVYRTDQFDILSACLFNRIGTWSFLHIAAKRLYTRQGEPDFLKIMQEVPRVPQGAWRASAFEALADL
jgi:transcriptional regulator with XRE-family HTH domain